MSLNFWCSIDVNKLEKTKMPIKRPSGLTTASILQAMLARYQAEKSKEEKALDSPLPEQKPAKKKRAKKASS
ncbi:hypothetical protein K9N68_33765 [Kovacikia minuta CCNUW1]|uniref:hypothetical protein n=1 Tax=Kovacikia minuta TaxID=2931930 RepID=UPI001CC9900D|nr:hypothetical protein [Kovacikia minuta]UBF26411.1 hypothetical protein K9N68_33765 [Kovacikia minuta CCNUW1]